MGCFPPGPTQKLARGGGITWALDDGTFWSIDLSSPLFAFGFASGLTQYGLTYTRAASPLAAQWGTGNVFDLSFFSGTANVYISTRFNNAWRAGIALGAARTNLVTNWRNFAAASWSLFGGATQTPTPAQLDPFGAAGARLIAAPSLGGIGEFVVSGATGITTGSAFILGATPNLNLIGSARQATTFTSPAAWSRGDVTTTAGGGASAIVPVDGRDWSALGGYSDGARSVYLDVVQREAGAFPSDPIPTTGTIGTRAAAFLNLTSAKVSEGLIAGRLQLELNLRAQGSLAEIGGTPHLLWADAGNRITIDSATGVISIVIGGVTNTTAAITLARYDTLDVFVCFGGSIATTFIYRKNGGAWTSLAVAGSALGSITPANMWLLSQSTAGAHFDGWLYKVAAYQPNRRPVWSLN